MNTNIKKIRLNMPWGPGLYRYSPDKSGNGIPSRIEAFVKDPAARKILGRWAMCPNINVALRIAKDGSLEGRDEKIQQTPI